MEPGAGFMLDPARGIPLLTSMSATTPTVRASLVPYDGLLRDNFVQQSRSAKERYALVGGSCDACDTEGLQIGTVGHAEVLAYNGLDGMVRSLPVSFFPFQPVSSLKLHFRPDSLHLFSKFEHDVLSHHFTSTAKKDFRARPSYALRTHDALLAEEVAWMVSLGERIGRVEARGDETWAVLEEKELVEKVVDVVSGGEGEVAEVVVWKEGKCVWVDLAATGEELRVCCAAVAGKDVEGGRGGYLCDECMDKPVLSADDCDDFGYDKIPGVPEDPTDYRMGVYEQKSKKDRLVFQAGAKRPREK